MYIYMFEKYINLPINNPYLLVIYDSSCYTLPNRRFFMILVNITYEVISPESASNGDFHETGFQVQDLQFNDRSEALEYFNDRYGCYQDQGNNSYSTSDPDRDLYSGHETYYTIHFDTTPRPTLKLT